MLGFTRTLKHVSGKEITIERSEVTQPFQTILLRGQGMPIRGQDNRYGALHVTCKVKLPQLTNKELEEFSAILKLPD